MSISMRERVRSSVATFLVPLLLGAGSANASVDIDQQPLLVAKPVPGNMAIIGSFEFPTMVTRAYKTEFNVGGEYVGYFDSAKCYKYQYDEDEARRHFFPTRFVTDNEEPCGEADEWSGKYLNWATMQSIDIFRHILTGGYRHVDTSKETWLEKGVQTGQGNSGNNFPDATYTGNPRWYTAAGLNGFKNWDNVVVRIGRSGRRLGNKMLFTEDGDLNGTSVPYNPAIHSPSINSFDTNPKQSKRTLI
jgi:type IV pilus assembly protein PilY1